MLIKAFGGAIQGIRGTTITIEVNVSQGIRFMIVGLADHSVRESQQRVELAITNNGFQWPRFRVVVNLAPASIRKEGTHFDLPLAVGILAATGQVADQLLKDYVILGELSLDGSVMPVKGILPMTLKAKEMGFRGVVVPHGNGGEASAVDGIEVVPVTHLKQVVSFLDGSPEPVPAAKKVVTRPHERTDGSGNDFREVRGQEAVKRALLIAAAGHHNVIMVGPPGSGKTMLARSLPSIMPPMSPEESLQTTIIHSVAGKVGPEEGLMVCRPFRTPHHSSSHIAIIGGGSTPQLGEVSLAHNGVLFLDELPEFKRQVLEVMRQPLEEGKIHVSRASYRVVYPSDFMLVAAMNPCPCGYYGYPGKDCNCGPGSIRTYLSRISGPLLDRIDIHMEVAPIPFERLSGDAEAESSEAIRKQVVLAREVQKKRFEGIPGVNSNSRMGTVLRNRYCRLDRAGESLIKRAIERLGLSVRAYDRILKVARTIADIEGDERIHASHVAEAISYRNLDREGWSG
jgi:magnesium chelatase family protein